MGDARAAGDPPRVRGGRQGQDEEQVPEQGVPAAEGARREGRAPAPWPAGRQPDRAQRGPGRVHRRLRRRPVQAAHLPLLDNTRRLASAAVPPCRVGLCGFFLGNLIILPYKKKYLNTLHSSAFGMFFDKVKDEFASWCLYSSEVVASGSVCTISSVCNSPFKHI